jgi:hypothetical protein
MNGIIRTRGKKYGEESVVNHNMTTRSSPARIYEDCAVRTLVRKERHGPVQ